MISERVCAFSESTLTGDARPSSSHGSRPVSPVHTDKGCAGSMHPLKRQEAQLYPPKKGVNKKKALFPRLSGGMGSLFL